ncbi:hypothetical protein [Treponema sp.]|uniref:hypothetical protein n=1 Tax=Treponema sp. TaxID=166 RepID=UPI0025E0A473|nr:hypothetical protein [Treponema sp.]MCR5218606.1 hypothetical protein [Treponema sp.]
MKHFRKIWNAALNKAVLETKGMKRQEALAYFYFKFPEMKEEVSAVAFYNQRSRLKAADSTKGFAHNRTKRPLYSEQVKKGYVRIKIAQPNVWISKAKWVYMETHPWEDCTERSNYIFLDGNTRNFHPSNIERVPLRLMALFSSNGGCVPGNPEATRINLLNVKLKNKIFDAGEKLGLVTYAGSGKTYRYFKKKKTEYARKRNADPKVKKRNCELQKKYREKMKRENPEKFEAKKAQHREYLKTYYARRRKEAGKCL